MVSGAAGVSPPQRPTSHFAALDGTRGVLALTIVLMHFGLSPLMATVTRGVFVWAPWGFVVDVFFMLSGFVLTRAYLLRRRTLAQMVVERLFRLLPVHWIIMLPMMAVWLVAEPRAWFQIVADFAAASIYFGWEPWNGPSWSINIELYLPILLFLTVGLVRSGHRTVHLALLVAVLLLSGVLAQSLKRDVMDWVMIPRGFAGLAAGSLLFHVKQRFGPLPGWRPPLFLLLAGFFVLLVLGGRVDALLHLLPFMGAALIWFGSEGSSILGQGPFRFLGYVSYPLYMVHYAVLDLALYLLGPDALDGAVVLKAALIGGSVVLAWLLAISVEQPAMRFGRRVANGLGQRPGALPGPTAP